MYTKVSYFVRFSKISYSGCILHSSLQSRDISVRVVTTLRVGRPRSRGFGSRHRQKNIALLRGIQTDTGVYQAFYLLGIVTFFCGIKRSDCEFEHSPQYDAEFERKWSCTYTPDSLRGVVLARNKDSSCFICACYRTMDPYR